MLRPMQTDWQSSLLCPTIGGLCAPVCCPCAVSETLMHDLAAAGYSESRTTVGGYLVSLAVCLPCFTSVYALAERYAGVDPVLGSAERFDSEALLELCCMSWMCPIPTAYAIRRGAVARYHIRESAISSAITAACCWPCSIWQVQEQIHSEKVGFKQFARYSQANAAQTTPPTMGIPMPSYLDDE